MGSVTAGLSTVGTISASEVKEWKRVGLLHSEGRTILHGENPLGSSYQQAVAYLEANPGIRDQIRVEYNVHKAEVTAKEASRKPGEYVSLDDLGVRELTRRVQVPAVNPETGATNLVDSLERTKHTQGVLDRPAEVEALKRLTASMNPVVIRKQGGKGRPAYMHVVIGRRKFLVEEGLYNRVYGDKKDKD